MVSPFGIIFCGERGDCSGVTGQSSSSGRNRSPEFSNRPEPEKFIDSGGIITSPSTVGSALFLQCASVTRVWLAQESHSTQLPCRMIRSRLYSATSNVPFVINLR